MKKILLLSALFPAVTSGVSAAPETAVKPVVVQPQGQPDHGRVASVKSSLSSVKASAAMVAAAKVSLPKSQVVMASSGVPSTLQKLSNGVTFVARPDNLAPRAAISLVIDTGAAAETPATAGWRRLLVNAMLRGAPQGFEGAEAAAVAPTPGEGLPRAAEKLGGSIGATVGDDFVEIYVSGDSNQAPQLLDLALALWQHPRLSTQDIQGARERAQSQVDADDLDTAGKTQAALRSQLFRDQRGELSSYGLSDFGTAESLSNLTDEKLRSLHATSLAPARLTVAATGNFDAAALRARLQSLPVSSAREAAAPVFAPPKMGTPALIVRELPVPSAWVFVSYPLAGNTNRDAPALRVLAAALGDSSKARLPGRLLENQPVGSNPAAISVAAQFVPRRYAGEMVLFAQTNPQSVDKVKNALLDEMRKVRDTPLSASELESAKTYARGSWSVERQNLRERAFQTALSPALGGPADTAFPARLEAVSSAEVQRVAKKYLGAYAVALVMPAE